MAFERGGGACEPSYSTLGVVRSTTKRETSAGLQPAVWHLTRRRRHRFVSVEDQRRQRVLDLLADGRPRNHGEIDKTIGGKAQQVRYAVDELVAEGVLIERQEGRAKLISRNRPYPSRRMGTDTNPS